MSDKNGTGIPTLMELDEAVAEGRLRPEQRDLVIRWMEKEAAWVDAEELVRSEVPGWDMLSPQEFDEEAMSRMGVSFPERLEKYACLQRGMMDRRHPTTAAMIKRMFLERELSRREYGELLEKEALWTDASRVLVEQQAEDIRGGLRGVNSTPGLWYDADRAVREFQQATYGSPLKYRTVS